MNSENMNDDPYNDVRHYHKGAKLNARGQASALCYPIPRPIPDTERWTIRDEAVTCKKCLKILAVTKPPNGPSSATRPDGEHGAGDEQWGCAWIPKCREEATHFHFMFGELCPKHAAEVMRLYPKDKVKRLTI